MRGRTLGLAVAVGCLLTAGAARAGSQPIFGQRLIIKNSVPEDESNNRLAIVGRSGLITVPAPLSDGDPTCQGAGGGGATLEVSSVTSGETMTLALPCELWETGRRGGGFRYLDRQLAQSACRSIQIKPGRSLKISCHGRGAAELGYDLKVGIHQAPIQAVLRLGATPEVYCMEFGGLLRKNGTDAKTYFATRAPAPAACP